MSYKIADLESDLTGIGHGTSLNKIKNAYYLYWRAARNVLGKIDPDMTIKITQITNGVHDDIYDYVAPSDLKGRKVIDIRPQINRNEGDNFGHRGISRFDLTKPENTFTIRFNTGEKILRLSKNVTPNQIVIHQMDSITNNGTWEVGDDGENLTRDANNYISGGASLNFDVTGVGTTGSIINSTMAQVDLSEEDEVGVVFVRHWIPDASRVTSFTLDWGNDTFNYWSRTVETTHDSTAFVNGWNILAFNWNGARETGTVDPATIDYLKFLITYDGEEETDFRVDRITCSRGEIYEIVYYSEFLFRSSAGTWIAKPTADTDIINLDEDAYNLFVNECALLMAQQQQGEDMGADWKFFKEQLYGDQTRSNRGLYEQYKADHPSQAIKMVDFYWNPNLYRK